MDLRYRYAKIHSRLINGDYPKQYKKLRKVAHFWEYVRYKAAGTGRAVFSISAAAKHLGKGESTIRSWITLDKKYHCFFRSISSEGDIMTAYHCSLFAICKFLGFENWGATAEIKPEYLKNAKVIATQIQTKQQQNASRHLAQKQARAEGRCHKVARPETLITPSSSSSKGVLVQHVSDTRTFVGLAFQPYGASHAGIAEVLGGISSRTVRRHLSHREQQRRNLPTFEKRQICYQIPSEAAGALDYARLYPPINNERKQLFRASERVYAPGCNIYDLPWQLVSCKTQKYWFKRRSRIQNQ